LRQSHFSDSIILHEFVHFLFDRWISERNINAKQGLFRLLSYAKDFMCEFEENSSIHIKDVYDILDFNDEYGLQNQIYMNLIYGKLYFNKERSELDLHKIMLVIVSEYIAHLIQYAYLRNNGYTQNQLKLLVFTSPLISQLALKCHLTYYLTETIFNIYDDRIKHIAEYCFNFYSDNGGLK